MKSYRHFYTVAVFILSILIFGCKKDYNPATDATSQICSNVKGTEAVFWDLMNGIPRTDIPGGLPTIKNIGGSYIHPTYPPLGFIYPAGWTTFTDNNSGWIGVNVIRNDNQAIWRYSGVFTGTAYTTSYVLNTEVSTLRSFLGSTGTVNTICSNGGTLPRAPGIVTTGQSVYITFDNFSAVVGVSITTVDGVSGEQIFVDVAAAPTDEFANEILNTFLPISYQLLYTGSGELDSDGDGVPDSSDDFPFDPNQHVISNGATAK